MTDIDDPWEPPFAGTEIEHIVGALGRPRATFRWKAGELDATQQESNQRSGRRPVVCGSSTGPPLNGVSRAPSAARDLYFGAA